jgi:hypothetical protein
MSMSSCGTSMMSKRKAFVSFIEDLVIKELLYRLRILVVRWYHKEGQA